MKFKKENDWLFALCIVFVITIFVIVTTGKSYCENNPEDCECVEGEDVCNKYYPSMKRYDCYENVKEEDRVKCLKWEKKTGEKEYAAMYVGCPCVEPTFNPEIHICDEWHMEWKCKQREVCDVVESNCTSWHKK